MHEASVAVRSAKQLRDHITGGLLTQALEAMGDVLFASAIDHLRQAQRSPRKDERVAHAAGDLQTAYYAFTKATQRGVPSLRRFAEVKGLRRTRGKAAGTAATVVALQFHLGEDPENLRTWLDRVAYHVSENWRDWRARERAQWWAQHVGWWDDNILQMTTPLDDYFALESRVLPPSHVRERPFGFRSLKTLNEIGYVAPPNKLDDEAYWRPRYDRDRL